MKRLSFFVFTAFTSLLFLTGSCQTGERISSDTKIKDIPVITRQDTISYALGIVWANGIAKIGKNSIAPAFYHGVTAYLHNDHTVMDVYQAEKYLDDRFEKMKYDSTWPTPDLEKRLSGIELITKFDTLSYALGMAWCRGAKQQGIDTITPALLSALFRSLQHDSTFFNYPKADQYLWAYIETLRAAKFSDVKAKNEQWLEQNKKKPGVITLPSGLQYKVIRKGTGRTPQTGDLVECRYVASLIDGTTFESSFADNEGEPLRLFTTAAVKGWQEAFPLMCEGDTWELYVPAHLAYGSGGMKDLVPAFATIIYELELIRAGQ